MRLLGNWFPAILKSADGEELSAGEACFDRSAQEIEFTSDFVPLFPLGTPMKIERVYEGADIHDFSGQVYLSSKKLMRLVSVRDTPRYGAQYVYCSNLKLNATVRFPEGQPQKKPLLFFSSKAAKRKESTAVVVSSVNPQGVTLLHDILDPFAHGQTLLMQLHEPAPALEAELVVARELLFGDRASYFCRFERILSGSIDALGHYIYENYPLDY